MDKMDIDIIENNDKMDIDITENNDKNKSKMIIRMDIDKRYSIAEDIDFTMDISDIKNYILIKKDNKETKYLIKKYFGKIEDFDINNNIKEVKELVLPLPFINNKMESTFDPMKIEMALIYLSNQINKINKKYKARVVKPLKREDCIYINLMNGDIRVHKDGIRLFDFNVDIDNKYKDSLIFIPLGFLFEEIGHLNVIVINNKLKKITIYEPYGDLSLKNEEKITNSLSWLKSELAKKFKNYSFVFTYEFQTGVQKRSMKCANEMYNQTENYCVAWCLYICLFSLYNIKLETDLTYSFLLDCIYTNYYLDNCNLLKFISKFTDYIKEKTDNYTSDEFDKNDSIYGYIVIKNINNIINEKSFNLINYRKQKEYNQVNLASINFLSKISTSKVSKK